jgi:hypothetical protein
MMNWVFSGTEKGGRGLIEGICPEGLNKTTKHLSQVSQSADRDFNPGPSEYEAGVLTTQLQRCVDHISSPYRIIGNIIVL